MAKQKKRSRSEELANVKASKNNKSSSSSSNPRQAAGFRVSGGKTKKKAICSGPELFPLGGMSEWKSSGDFAWASRVRLEAFYSKDWVRFHEPVVREFVKNMQKDGLSSVVRGTPVVVSKGLVMEVFGLPGESDNNRKELLLKTELASEAHRAAVRHMVPREALKKDEGYLIDQAHGAYKLRLRGLNESFCMKKKSFLMAGGIIQALAYAETMHVDMASMFLSNLKREFGYLRQKCVSGTYAAPAITMLVMRCIPWIPGDYVLMQVANPPPAAVVVYGSRRDAPCQVNMMLTDETDATGAHPGHSDPVATVVVAEPVTTCRPLKKRKPDNNSCPECNVAAAAAEVAAEEEEELMKSTPSATPSPSTRRRYDLRKLNPNMPSTTTELPPPHVAAAAHVDVDDVGVKMPKTPQSSKKGGDGMVELMSLERSILKLHSYLPDIAVARNTMKENDDLKQQVADMTSKLSVQVEKLLSDHRKQKSEWEKVALNLEQELLAAECKERETRKKYEKIIAAKEKKIAKLGEKIIEENFRLENYDKLLVSSLSTVAESNLFREYVLKKSNPQLEYLKAALDEDIQKKCRYYVDEIEGLQNKVLDLTEENARLKEHQQHQQQQQQVVKTNRTSASIERPTCVVRGGDQGIKTFHEKIDLKTCSHDKLALLALSTIGLGARWDG